VTFTSDENAPGAKWYADTRSLDGPLFHGTGLFAGSVNFAPIAAPSGDHNAIQVGYEDGRIATIDVFSDHTPSNDTCHAQAQAVATGEWEQ